MQADHHIQKQPDDSATYAVLAETDVSQHPIENPGRVAYIAEHSNMALIIPNYNAEAGDVHFPLNLNEPDSLEIMTQLNELEISILQQRGALSLPPKELCDELVNAYFKWVHPIVPMVNRTRFMKQYRNPDDPPSILLTQAILLAGSRVCSTEMLLDTHGSRIPAATLFYQRAKALYDADYEKNRVTIVQALILMGWYWEEPGKVTKNVFYWNGLATSIAQGFGMHRSTRTSRLSPSDKKLWKRIWWTLVTRDRSVSVALGRPVHINLPDSDIEMIEEDDFVEDASDKPNALHVQFFIQYVKMCNIMDLVLLQNYSLAARATPFKKMGTAECDRALADWHRNCPREVAWNPARHNLLTAYLHCIYETTVCLLHRAHLPPAPARSVSSSLLRSPAFVSANAITSVVESLVAHNELNYLPPFV